MDNLRNWATNGFLIPSKQRWWDAGEGLAHPSQPNETLVPRSQDDQIWWTFVILVSKMITCLWGTSENTTFKCPFEKAMTPVAVGVTDR